MAAMQLSDYDYTLPEKLIAKHPHKVRGGSRLLVLHKDSGHIEHRNYTDLPEYLNKDDVVVRNNTQVIKARLLVTNSRGAQRELLLIENHGSDDSHEHTVLYRGKITAGEELKINNIPMTVLKILDGGKAVIGCKNSLYDIAEQFGQVPLPPYMHRTATANDTRRYQTEFAKNAGSVAAPTASLNFTNALSDKLLSKEVKIHELTLHVGLGTFLPIRTNVLEKHKMHSEFFVVPKSTITAISDAKNRGNNVLAIGTTVTRTLEHCASQIQSEHIKELTGEADIFIYPGYDFKTVDMLLTNFHAPKSTVLMMAAAFAGWNNLQKAYQEAINENYAFLSYGDSMLII